MVNTVLTDKTGTLTRNVLEFFKASIGGVSYGAGVTEIERANASRRGLQVEGGGADSCGVGVPPAAPAVEVHNPAREQYLNFFDERIMGGAWAGQPNPHLAKEFFRMLALCHTVIPDGERSAPGMGWGGTAASNALNYLNFDCTKLTAQPVCTLMHKPPPPQAPRIPSSSATKQSPLMKQRWWWQQRCLASSCSSAPTPHW